FKRGDMGGKTGTTNDSHDAWFAGYNPDTVGVVWMGFDQPRSLGTSETGGGAALPIWLDYMRHALDGKPVHEPPPVPSGLNRINGDFYFAEYPPAQAVARVGLSTPTDSLLGPGGGGEGKTFADYIGDLLHQLRTGTRERHQHQEVIPF